LKTTFCERSFFVDFLLGATKRLLQSRGWEKCAVYVFPIVWKKSELVFIATIDKPILKKIGANFESLQTKAVAVGKQGGKIGRIFAIYKLAHL
jgi:hypothetical protein